MNPPQPGPSLDAVEIYDITNLDSGKKWSVATYITPDDRVYTGLSDKLRKDLTLEEVKASLVLCPDSALYPPVPEGITIASPEIEQTAYLKRPPITDYVPGELDVGIVKQGLDETIIMETVSKLNHPNIVQYLGARVRRGLLTGFYVEELPQTLLQYCDTSAFKELDKDRFYEGCGVGHSWPTWYWAGLQRYIPGEHHDQRRKAGIDRLWELQACRGDAEVLWLTRMV